MIEQERLCKLHSCGNSCSFCAFSKASAKERNRTGKIKIKPVKHVSFVNHLCSVPPVENVHNVAQNLPVMLEATHGVFSGVWGTGLCPVNGISLLGKILTYKI